MWKDSIINRGVVCCLRFSSCSCNLFDFMLPMRSLIFFLSIAMSPMR